MNPMINHYFFDSNRNYRSVLWEHYGIYVPSALVDQGGDDFLRVVRENNAVAGYLRAEPESDLTRLWEVPVNPKLFAEALKRGLGRDDFLSRKKS